MQELDKISHPTIRTSRHFKTRSYHVHITSIHPSKVVGEIQVGAERPPSAILFHDVHFHHYRHVPRSELRRPRRIRQGVHERVNLIAVRWEDRSTRTCSGAMSLARNKSFRFTSHLPYRASQTCCPYALTCSARCCGRGRTIRRRVALPHRG
jgi:hypothetical protein